MSDPPLPTAELLRRALGARAAGRLRRAGVSLRDLNATSVSELVASYGLTEPAAARTAAVLDLARAIHTAPIVRGATYTGSADVFRHFHARLRDLKVEQVWVLLIDGKHRVIKEVLVSQGTLVSSPVHPREVFTAAIRHCAAAIVVAHQHPSGDSSPSADDMEISRRLRDVGQLIGIRLLDHVVIGQNEYTSFADKGLLS